MDTQDILIIRRIYETGSITKAASLLYISPQALSKRLQRIEYDLNTTLFTRTASGMVPTDDGTRFYHKSEKFFTTFHEFIESVKSPDAAEHRRITVSAALGVMALVTPEGLRSFQQAHPDIDIAVREYPDKQVDAQVMDGSTDIGLSIAPVCEDCARLQIRQYPFCVAVRHDGFLQNKKKITFEDLKGIPIAMENGDFKVNDIVRSACRSRGFRPDIYFETLELDLAHTLAEQGKCVAITVDSERFLPKSDALRILRFRNPQFWSIVAVKRPGESFDEAEKLLIEHISEILAEK